MVDNQLVSIFFNHSAQRSCPGLTPFFRAWSGSQGSAAVAAGLPNSARSATSASLGGPIRR